MNVKRLLPDSLRRTLWWLVRSGQRKTLGLKTLVVTDLKGSLVGRGIEGTPTIFACVAVYNRSGPLLNHLIDSLARCDEANRIVLCIADNGSTDVPNLREAVKARWPGELRWVDVERLAAGAKFNKSRVLNAALHLADSGIIAVCDADISVPRHFVRRCVEETGRFRAWFPNISWEEKDGRVREYNEGCGIAIVRYELLKRVGYLDESYAGWGHEDWEWYYRFYKHGIQAARSLELGIVHHYHERSKWVFS